MSNDTQATINGNESIGKALGRIPGGVFIATAEDKNHHKVGMLASWVQQAGFFPPTVSIAIHPDRELFRVIQQTGRFTINVISKQNHGLMKTFSRFIPGQFDQVEYVSTQCGLVFKEAVAAMDCVIKTKVDAGDHVVVIAEVVDGNVLNTSLEPMTHLRQSGFHY